MKKRVLITGSNGYIGQHLKKIIADRYQVFTIDLNDPKNPVDIRNTIPYYSNIDTVVHLAALANVSRSTRYPKEYFDTNINGTINVLEQIEYNNFMFASTGSAAGMASPYSISKKACELIVEDHCKKNDKDFTIFRFYNVVGCDGFVPKNPDGLILSLMKAEETGYFELCGTDYDTLDGTCLRDYTHVNEVCDAIIKAIDRPANGLEHLGHGVGTSVRQMAEIYKRVNNVDFEIRSADRRPGDLVSSVVIDKSSYIEQLYSIDDMLRNTITK
jgi:UDP-glucose 4-epimerase